MPRAGEVAGADFTATVSKALVLVGDTATLRFTLTNTSPNSLRWDFGDGCQIIPYVVNEGGAIVYPPSGFWGCLTVITHLELAPGEQEVLEVLVRGGAPAPAIYPGVPLAPGRYAAYAELKGVGRSSPVTFIIVPTPTM